MYYLIKNANSNLEILDDKILSSKAVWSCNSLVRSLKEKDKKLYYVTAGGNEVYTGEILSVSEIKKRLQLQVGMSIKLVDGLWHKIVCPDGLYGKFIVVPKKLDDGCYIQTYKNIYNILDNEVEDVKC